MSRPHSARERKIGNSGKTNAVQPGVGARPLIRPISAIARPSHENISTYLDSSKETAQPPTRDESVKATMSNDFYSTLYGTAEEKMITKPPMLPKNRFPLVPPLEPVPKSRYRRPLICPDWWLEHNLESTMFDRAGFKTNIDEKEKSHMIDDFMRRNKHRLALFDYSYKKMTPDEVRETLMQVPNLLNVMTTYAITERRYVNGTSSARMRSLLDQSRYESLGEVKKDPYRMSLNASRAEHNDKLERLLSTQPGGKPDFARGYAHAAEYRNFSNFNSILKSNQNSILHR